MKADDNTTWGDTDTLGEELAPDARIWRDYTKEAAQQDASLLENLNRTCDVILVFAALFSAVVATFLISSFANLSQDPQDVTNALLANIYDTLTDNSSASAMPPYPQHFAPSTSTIWINTLWFTSLTSSLSAGSVAMLGKQWLNAYTTGLPASPHPRSLIRHHRHYAFIRWYTPDIINSLPSLLSLCLMLFLSGLSIMLYDTSPRVALASIVIFSITLLFHLASLILPAVCDCPWKTAVSSSMHWLLLPARLLPHALKSGAEVIAYLARASTVPTLRFFRIVTSVFVNIGYVIIAPFSSSFAWLWLVIVWLRDRLVLLPEMAMPGTGYQLIIPPYLQRIPYQRLANTLARWSRIPIMPYVYAKASYARRKGALAEPEEEYHHVLNRHTIVQVQALIWMIRSANRQEYVDHSLQAIAGLPLQPLPAQMLVDGGVLPLIQHRLSQCVREHHLDKAPAELYVRALLRLRTAMRIGQHDSSLADDWLLPAKITNAVAEGGQKLGKATTVTCICASSMLYDMLDTLEKHFGGTDVLPPFQVQLLIETIGYELYSRKGHTGDHWELPSQSWITLTRIIPHLILSLNIDRIGFDDFESDGGWSGLDWAIVTTIAVFTKSVNLSATRPRFEHLAIDALSDIARFPLTYGCDASVSQVASKKLVMAGRRLLMQRNPSSRLFELMPVVLRVLPAVDADCQASFLSTFSDYSRDRWQPGQFDLQSMMKMLTSSKSSQTRRHLLILTERAWIEHRGPLTRAQTDIAQSLAHELGKEVDYALRRQIFYVLGLIGWAASSQSVFSVNKVLASNLLSAIRAFYADPASLNEDEVDRWVYILERLSNDHPSMVISSSALATFIAWSQEHWKGRELTYKHVRRLEDIAEQIGLCIPPYSTTDWFNASYVPPKAGFKAR